MLSTYKYLMRCSYIRESKSLACKLEIRKSVHLYIQYEV